MHGTSFPLFQHVDALLGEEVFLSDVLILGVILTAKHLFLLMKCLILASQSEQVDVQDGTLLRQLDHPTPVTLLVSLLKRLNQGFQVLILGLLLHSEVLLVAQLLPDVVLFLFVVALHLDVVLVKLVLGHQVAADALVKRVNLILL